MQDLYPECSLILPRVDYMTITWLHCSVALRIEFTDFILYEFMMIHCMWKNFIVCEVILC